MPNPSLPFISSPLGLILKHDGNFWRIHYLSYPIGRLVYNLISDGVGKLRYSKFQQILSLILITDHNSIIIKKNIKNSIQNVPITPYDQWLLGFI